MPLKHHTETAYVVLLAIVISAYGFFLSLLPHFPEGVLYWCILAVVALLYPLLLAPTFKTNRADYEFRFLHWAPAIMMLLWLALELLSRRFAPALILQLGFLYLWSLPLVVLGVTLVILFCLHVIRRQSVRLPILGGILAAFFALSLSAEAFGWNESVQQKLFPQNTYADAVSRQYTALVATVAGASSSSSSASRASIGSSSVSSTGVSSSASRSVLSSSAIIARSEPPVSSAPTKKPGKLPGSGPEDVIGILFVTLMALYSRTLHVRTLRRLEVA